MRDGADCHMASMTDFARQDGRPRRGFAAATDRTRAFRTAARHTLLVRILRVGLPLASLALAGYYGLAMKLSMGIDGVTLPAMPTITADNLKMENPRYEGFNKDGSRFVVTAKTAQQDVMSRTAPIKLTGIQGEIVQPDKSVTRLSATAGTFDTTANTLELRDGIDIVGDNGLKAVLQRARVATKDATVTSSDPVMVEMPAGTIRSNALVLKQKQRQVTFSAGVAARLNPQAQAPKTAATTAETPAASRDTLGRRDVPVDVTAEQLVVDDIAKTATFRGSVRASQGTSQLESAELEIAYTGQAALPSAAAKPAPTPAITAASPSSKVRAIVSRTPVVLTQGPDRVTAETAHFDVETERAHLAGKVTMSAGADRRALADTADLDQKAETVLLTGNVQLVQGKNELRGGRLWLDRKAGRSQVTTPGGRIWARFVQPDGRRNAAAKKETKPAAGPASGGAAGLLGSGAFKTNPEAPIVIDADRLDVDDRAHRAIFRGDVHAAQDAFKVRTAELTAIYAGGAGLAFAATPGGSEPAKGQARLTRIEARKGVVVTGRDGQRASGDWANFDVKANTIVLGGNVTIAQGRDSVRAPQLAIDLTTGQYVMATVPGSESQSIFTQSGGGRPSAIIYPDRLRANRTKQKPEAEARPAAPAASAEPAFQFNR